MNLFNWVTVALTAMLVTVGTPIEAQRAPTTTQRPVLDFNADVFGGWDVELSDPVTIQGDDRPLGNNSSTYGGLNGSLDFSRTAGRVVLGVGGVAAVRRHWGLVDGLVPSVSGTFSAGAPIGPRVSWQVAERIGYAPLNALSFYPLAAGVVAAPVSDYQIADSQQLTSETNASMTVGLSRRGQLAFQGSFSELQSPTDVTDTTDSAETSIERRGWVRRWSAGGRYSHQITRSMSLYGGYTFARSEQPTSSASSSPLGASPELHYIDAGVGFQRPLSLSRRTKLAMQFGTSVMNAASDGGREFSIVGNATLSHQVGRSWSLSSGYERNVRFVAAFLDPVTISGITAGADGLFGRRAGVRFFANVSRGRVGVGTDGNDIASYSMSAQLRYALQRRFGLYAEYFYFQSQFGSFVPLPDEFGRDLRRNGIRFGFTMGRTLAGPRR